MTARKVLILAAGKGTRMGSIGKYLPKPLWPIMKSSLLELQIKSWVESGVNEIYVNCYHQKEMIKDYLFNNYPSVNVILESEKLDVGGAVHNLAGKLNYNGMLYVSTVDSFIFSNEETVAETLWKTYDKEATANLALIKVDARENYTHVLTNENNRIIKFEKKMNESDYWTFSGVSLINLEKLEKVLGESKFFESVCPYKTEKVNGHKFEEAEFWDFGTLEQYYQRLLQLLTSDSKLSRLVKKHGFDEKILVS